ncbi:Pre-protein translocase subunit YajC [Elusimicrobium minutum Pei191]|uniref:Sec translocon accessory complex subunit YajC n=1 Tax=Elusimicrobium minutum (strain Pei191) TaxID=445932 RepID=B2KBZ2_ELUMP|nr:preprotein translocase subunit YajC [Elusimicrobium minutum]ACC98119.1 Pre-protein translocase subunit YajC [Elusimicrobium minutum Pei191]
MEAAGGGSALNLIMIFVAALFLIMMVMSSRGDKKRAQVQREMIDALKKDDKVVIFGGIVGTIAGFKDDMVEVKLSETNKITVLKTSIVKAINK